MTPGRRDADERRGALGHLVPGDNGRHADPAVAYLLREPFAAMGERGLYRCLRQRGLRERSARWIADAGMMTPRERL